MKRRGEIVVDVADGHPRLINYDGQTYVVQRIIKTWTRHKGRLKRKVAQVHYHVDVGDAEMQICNDGGQWRLVHAAFPGDGEQAWIMVRERPADDGEAGRTDR